MPPLRSIIQPVYGKYKKNAREIRVCLRDIFPVKCPRINRIQGIDSLIRDGRGEDASGSGHERCIISAVSD